MYGRDPRDADPIFTKEVSGWRAEGLIHDSGKLRLWTGHKNAHEVRLRQRDFINIT